MESSVYQGDCCQVMRDFLDESVDMTLTSPPYDMIRAYNGYVFDYKKVADELYRVTKEGGIVVWVVGDQTISGSESCSSFRQALYFKEIGFNLHDTMIYQKDNPVPVGGNNRYYQHFEYMFVFSKGKPKTFNPIMVERRNKHNDKRTERVKGFNRSKDGNFTKRLVKISDRVKLGNVWKYVVGGGNSVEYGVEHPAAFPMQMAIDHILSWSNEGDIVLDPMAGSGTSLLAAKKLNRKYIGIEISETYVKYIKNRLAGEYK